MENVWGSITSMEDWTTVENFLFTYSEEEKEENSLNRLNAGLILNPKFIPVYTCMLKDFSLLEATIYWFIDYFLWNNEKFYCTNEQLAEMLNVSITSVSNAMTTLKQKWLIDITYKIKAWGWKIRFVRLTKSENTTYKICESNLQNMVYIENKKIENKKIYNRWITKNVPSASELVEAYKQDELLVKKMNDEQVVRERAEYKQSRKDRAYKTVNWFIQQLNVWIDTVRFGWLRWDTSLRFRFAMNQAMENDWKKLYWNEQIEREYQSWRQSLTLMNKHHEQ